jgi:hypothetical protein
VHYNNLNEQAKFITANNTTSKAIVVLQNEKCNNGATWRQ